MRQNFYKICLLCVLTVITTPARSEISDRRMIFVRPGVGEVYFQYVFSVNETTETQRKIEIPLPENTLDFILQEGAEKKDTTLGEKGQLVIDKTFPAGSTIVSVLFKVKSGDGSAAIKWSMGEGKLESAFLTLDQQLQFKGLRELTGNENPFGRNYRAFVPTDAGHIEFFLHGLPTSRRLFWMIGIGTAIVLVGLSLLLTTQAYRRIKIHA